MPKTENPSNVNQHLTGTVPVNTGVKESFGIEEIKKYLPHRYPFLLVDRVKECILGQSIVCIKNVTFNEAHFMGHFPEQSVMPGVLIVEALAQAAGILAYKSMGWKPGDALFYLGAVENARFKKMVTPGDQLILTVEVLKIRTTVWKFKGVATVDGDVACLAEMTSISTGAGISGASGTVVIGSKND